MNLSDPTTLGILGIALTCIFGVIGFFSYKNKTVKKNKQTIKGSNNTQTNKQ